MADKEEGEETIPRGNEWEVVSLTASTYAAAPGPEQAELNDSDKGNTVEEDEAGTSRAMFLSGHFVFPPSQHENLPVEPQNIEIQNMQGIEDDALEFDAEEGGKSDTKDGKNWSIEGLAIPDEFHGIQFFDEKGSKLSVHGTDFEEGTTLQGLNLSEKEQSMYSASKLSSFHSETTMGGSTTYDENMVISGQIEPSEGGCDSNISQVPKPEKEDKYDSSESWWKRQATSLYAHAKETNAFWSIFIAAAVMGLVIIGQHWQQERWKVLQFKSQFSINDEKTGRMLGSIFRLKDVIVGGNRRGSSIRGSTSTEL